MEPEACARVEAWIKDVESALRATPRQLYKRGMSFKNSEFAASHHLYTHSPPSSWELTPMQSQYQMTPLSSQYHQHSPQHTDFLSSRPPPPPLQQQQRDEAAGPEEIRAVPRLSWRTAIFYGAPSFSLTSMTMLIGIHGSVFYIGIGAHLAFYALFVAIARSFDVFTDPIMGWISDVTHVQPTKRTESKYWFVRQMSRFPIRGRRRPYMVLFAVFYAICIVGILSPPKSLVTDWKISVWFGVFYFFFYIADTASNVPYNALGPELSDNSKERDRLFFVTNMFKYLGILVGATLPVLLTTLVFNSYDDLVGRYPAPDPPMLATPTPTLTLSVETHECPRGDFSYNMPFAYERCWGKGNALCECLDSTRADDLTGSLDGKRRAMTTVALIFGVEYVVSMVACVYKVRERVQGLGDQSPPVVPAVLATMRNRPFMQLLPAWILDMTAVTMLGTMLPFFAEYVVKPWAVPECDPTCCGTHGESWVYSGCRSQTMCQTDTWLGIGLVALFTTALLSMPVWLRLTRSFGKRRVWLAFNLLTAITNGVFIFVGAGDPIFMCVLAAMNGIPAGAQFLTDSIVADVIDYDELLTGVRSEARFTIFQTFLPKMVSIPAQTIPISLLSVFGFVTPCEDGPYHPQPESVGLFLQVVFYVLPTLCSFGSLYFKLKFPLNERNMDLIREGCALHMEGKPAQDPVTGRIHRLPSYARNHHVLKTAVWKLDNFFVEQLELLLEDSQDETPMGRTDGRREVIRQLSKLIGICGVVTVMAIGITVASLVTGMIHSQTTAWVPVFGVISTGMAITILVFNYQRRLVAKDLLERPLVWSQCRVVLSEVINNRKGVDAKRAVNQGWFTQLQQPHKSPVQPPDDDSPTNDPFLTFKSGGSNPITENDVTFPLLHFEADDWPPKPHRERPETREYTTFRDVDLAIPTRSFSMTKARLGSHPQKPQRWTQHQSFSTPNINNLITSALTTEPANTFNTTLNGGAVNSPLIAPAPTPGNHTAPSSPSPDPPAGATSPPTHTPPTNTMTVNLSPIPYPHLDDTLPDSFIPVRGENDDRQVRRLSSVRRNPRMKSPGPNSLLSSSSPLTRSSRLSPDRLGRGGVFADSNFGGYHFSTHSATHLLGGGGGGRSAPLSPLSPIAATVELDVPGSPARLPLRRARSRPRRKTNWDMDIIT
eukprot:Sspe_Gene.73698::Locus_44714_Transcript_1_1_Confidence_1.000_Length_3688::g.73698::m.73698